MRMSRSPVLPRSLFLAGIVLTGCFLALFAPPSSAFTSPHTESVYASDRFAVSFMGVQAGDWT